MLIRYATWRKKTPGAIFLRKIMRKFDMVDHALAAHHWDIFYSGYDVRGLSQAERSRRNHIENSSYNKAKSKQIVETLDGSTPFRSRLEFIEALAALSSMFPEDMNRKVTGANQRVGHVLWCAADPDRTEWLLNNLRWRHSLRVFFRFMCVCALVFVFYFLFSSMRRGERTYNHGTKALEFLHYCHPELLRMRRCTVK